MVCGGRDFNRKDVLDRVLLTAIWKSGNHHPRDAMTPDPNKVIIISGMAKGADTMAVQFAKTHKLKVLEFPADWDTHGKAAGPIRNQEMLIRGVPDLVVAFPTKNSRGTWDMVRRAEKAGVKVIVVKEDEVQ